MELTGHLGSVAFDPAMTFYPWVENPGTVGDIDLINEIIESAPAGLARGHCLELDN
jgi:hypothetical protein